MATIPAPALDPVAARAERARRNGARSRGPRTEAGKARSSRNALTHGLTARVHLLQHGEDEPAFQGLTTRLFAELAPTGEVDGFLVANLAAAMWRTGRAHQLEGIACDGPSGLDERRLGLALRYHGSASRELFRSLRALADLRRRPLAAQPAAGIAEGRPPTATVPGAIPAVAQVAWGGACPPAPPPGCMMLRPVPGRPPASWRHVQHNAFPGAEPVPVDADGIAYALVGGAWVPQAQPAPEPPPPPPALPPRPAPPLTALPIAPQPAPRAAPPRPPEPIRTPVDADTAPALRHNLTLADLADPAAAVDPDPRPAVAQAQPCPAGAADPEPCPPRDTQRRNEPRMARAEPVEFDEDDPDSGTRSAIAPRAITDDPSKWYLMWGLAAPETADPHSPTLQPPEPDQAAADDCVPTSRPDRPAPDPPPATTITASDGGPSWLTRSRAGRKGVCAPRPLLDRLRAAATTGMTRAAGRRTAPLAHADGGGALGEPAEPDLPDPRAADRAGGVDQ